MHLLFSNILMGVFHFPVFKKSPPKFFPHSSVRVPRLLSHLTHLRHIPSTYTLLQQAKINMGCIKCIWVYTRDEPTEIMHQCRWWKLAISTSALLRGKVSQRGAGNSQRGAGNSQGGVGNSKISLRGSFQNGELPYAHFDATLTFDGPKSEDKCKLQNYNETRFLAIPHMEHCQCTTCIIDMK